MDLRIASIAISRNLVLLTRMLLDVPQLPQARSPSHTAAQIPTPIPVQLGNPQDLVEIWTQRAIAPANEIRIFKLANAIRTNLRDDSGLEPIILLLTHPWFGAEKKISRIQGLRGLFVQYPSMQVQPAIAHLCERYSYIDAKQTADLGQILGYLMG